MYSIHVSISKWCVAFSFFSFSVATMQSVKLLQFTELDVFAEEINTELGVFVQKEDKIKARYEN